MSTGRLQQIAASVGKPLLENCSYNSELARLGGGQLTIDILTGDSSLNGLPLREPQVGVAVRTWLDRQMNEFGGALLSPLHTAVIRVNYVVLRDERDGAVFWGLNAIGEVEIHTLDGDICVAPIMAQAWHNTHCPVESANTAGVKAFSLITRPENGS